MELRPHQRKSLEEIVPIIEKYKLCLLSGEQRIGKSLIALSLANIYGGEVLFVTRKKAIKSVESDAEALGMTCKLTIINTESLHKITPIRWKLIICDEAHMGYCGFPKRSKAWSQMAVHFSRSAAPALLMSGTLFPETLAQAFNMITMTGRGPWFKYKDFFSWWRPIGYHKNKVNGAYGVADAIKRTGTGFDCPDYAAVHDDKIMKDINPYMVKCTREEAGFTQVNAKVVAVTIENYKIKELCDEIWKEGLIEIDGRTCVYETPAARLQGAHMAGGGCLIDDNGEAFILPDEYDPYYKARWIKEGAKDGKQYIIQTAFIHERKLLIDYLGATDDLDEFKDAGVKFWVGSLMSYSCGIDFSWISGTQILYSMPFSGAHYQQCLDRQLNFKREEPAIVAIPIGGIDAQVHAALKEKKNFTASFYRAIT